MLFRQCPTQLLTLGISVKKCTAWLDLYMGHIRTSPWGHTCSRSTCIQHQRVSNWLHVRSNDLLEESKCPESLLRDKVRISQTTPCNRCTERPWSSSLSLPHTKTRLQQSDRWGNKTFQKRKWVLVKPYPEQPYRKVYLNTTSALI